MALHGPTQKQHRNVLRENFFLLLRRSYLIAEKQGRGLAVYSSIARTLYTLCGEPWVQLTIFPVETALVRRFLAETKLTVANPGSVVQKNLMSNSWRVVANTILQALNRPDFASLCSVTGAENLRAAQAVGRGVVVLHSHTVLAQLFWSWLEHENIALGVTLWQWTWEKDQSEIEEPRTRALEGARELHAARETLRQGGLVNVVGDGDKGTREVVLPFCNRRRGFQSAFAELAVSMNARVITADVHLTADGRISIEIGSPLIDTPPGHDHAEQVERLLRQYAAHLYRRWQAHPADLQWYIMRQHLSLPPL